MRPLLLLPLLSVLSGADFHQPHGEAARLPEAWETAWSLPLEDGSWSSPVVWKDTVYVTSEPTSLHAISVQSGTVRWSRSHPLANHLTEEQRAGFQAQQGELDRLTRAIEVKHKERQKAYRLMRRDKLSEEDWRTVNEEFAALHAELDRIAGFYTPARGDGLGYAVPTPHVDADGVVVSFATGLVVAWDHDGTRRWSTWLGVAPQPDRGYQGTDSASVVRAGDTVVVAHGALHGLDRSTGAIRWTGPSYADFGTPAVMALGGRHLVFTPDGHALDAADGRILASGLGATWYVGPTVVGDRVYWIGRDDAAFEEPIRAAGHRVRLGEDGLSTTPLFSDELPVSDRVYGHALPLGESLVLVTVRGSVVSLNALTGAVGHHARIEGLSGSVWSTPGVVGDHLVVTSRDGNVAVLQAQAPFEVRHAAEVPISASRAAFLDGAAIVRSGEAVTRVGSAGR